MHFSMWMLDLMYNVPNIKLWCIGKLFNKLWEIWGNWTFNGRVLLLVFHEMMEVLMIYFSSGKELKESVPFCLKLDQTKPWLLRYHYWKGQDLFLLAVFFFSKEKNTVFSSKIYLVCIESVALSEWCLD